MVMAALFGNKGKFLAFASPLLNKFLIRFVHNTIPRLGLWYAKTSLRILNIIGDLNEKLLQPKHSPKLQHFTITVFFNFWPPQKKISDLFP